MSKGFLRIEVIILIVVVFIVVSVLSLAFFSAKGAARDEKRIIDISQIRLALKSYFEENGFYPYSDGVSAPLGMNNFLDSWPQSPSVNPKCSKTQNNYSYSQKSNGDDYLLTFCLEQGRDGIGSGVRWATSKGIQ